MIAIFMALALILTTGPVWAQNPPNPPDPMRNALNNLIRQYQAHTISSDNLAQAIDSYQHAADEKIKSLEARVKELEEQAGKK